MLRPGDQWADRSPSVGGLIPDFAPIAPPRAAAIAAHVDVLGERVRYLIPSHEPDAPGYGSACYWRGPFWLFVNYMVADGLERAGHLDTAARIVAYNLKLIEVGGCSEFFDPETGAPCGGPAFTWTAAMVLEFLHRDAM